jgi:glycosyltransferase involved in cell wall biosynthesis
VTVSLPPGREPTLSVTVTNYNYGRFLAPNIESVLSQSFGDFELLLIDNASTDESLDVMHEYAAEDERIQIIAHPENLGYFASLREAGEVSRGRYRVPIEADDWVIEPDAFAAQVELLERHPAVTFVYSAMSMLGSSGDVHFVARAHDHDVVIPGPDALESILSFHLTHTGMMMRQDAYRATPGYDARFPHIADMHLGAQLCALGDVGYLNRRLYAFRQHDTNLHLRPQLNVVRNEMLPVIASAFEGPIAARLEDSAAIRRRVEQNALVHLPTQYVFSGQYRGGWRLFWESMKERPVATVIQPRTASLVSRTLLGQRGHSWLVSRVTHRPGRAHVEQ